MINKSKIIFSIKYSILSFASLFVLGPLWVMVVNSFKTEREGALIGAGLPEKWNLIENYSTVIIEGKLVRGSLNSLLLTIVSMVLIILFGSTVSWVIARGKNKLFSIMYYVFISGMLIPPAIISTIRVLDKLHLYGTYTGLILFYTGIFLPLIVFFTTGFIKNIPIELEEAAKIDGANSFGVFFKIIFPLLKPVRLTSMIFISLFVWNDFIYAFYYTSKSSQQTLMLGLFNFVSQYWQQIRWELVFADVVLVSLPLLILFIFIQKNIISGISKGAIKG